MDNIGKALQKLTPKEREGVKNVLKQLYSNKTENLDVKKLKGRNDIFRVRKGGIRILYRVESENVFVLVIERRHEDTYKK